MTYTVPISGGNIVYTFVVIDVCCWAFKFEAFYIGNVSSYDC